MLHLLPVKSCGSWPCRNEILEGRPPDSSPSESRCGLWCVRSGQPLPSLALGSVPVLPHQLPHPLAQGFPALSASRPAARPCLGQPGSQLSEPMSCASRGPPTPHCLKPAADAESLPRKLLGVCVGVRLLTSVSARGTWQPKARAASSPPGPSLCLLFSRKLELCLGRCESLLRVLLISRIFLFSVREVCWKHELA